MAQIPLLTVREPRLLHHRRLRGELQFHLLHIQLLQLLQLRGYLLEQSLCYKPRPKNIRPPPIRFKFLSGILGKLLQGCGDRFLSPLGNLRNIDVIPCLKRFNRLPFDFIREHQRNVKGGFIVLIHQDIPVIRDDNPILKIRHGIPRIPVLRHPRTPLE